MNWNPEEDGITHINVYSKGHTLLGRTLSNFAATSFRIPFMGEFCTVEGFWYWIMTGDNSLREMEGWEAKQEGRKLPRKRVCPTKRELSIAYRAKLRSYPKLREALKENKLPLAHYYVYGGKIVEPKEWQWTVDLWYTVVGD